MTSPALASDGLLTLTTLLHTEPLMTLKLYPFGALLQQRTAHGQVEYLVDPAQLAVQLAATVRLDTGILTAQTISVTQIGLHKVVVDYRPRKKTALFLEGSEAPLVVPLPELLLVRRTTDQQSPEYRVFAVKQRPTNLEIPLFHAPLPNLYRDGRVCWGTVPQLTPAQLQLTSLTEDWRLLLGTRFGSHNVTHKSQRYPTDIRQHYLQLEQRKARVYPKGDLLPFQRTLGEVLEDLHP